MPLVRQRAAEPDLAVGDSLDRVGDRLVEIIAFHQNGIKTGDRAAGRAAGALQHLGQQREDTGRISALRRRLLGGEPDLSLRVTHARQRIHQQQHVLALIAEIFGDSRRDLGGAHAQQRRLIAGADDDDTLFQPPGSQRGSQKFLDLASALADQCDDRDIGAGVFRDGGNQRAFPDAGAREDAHALSDAAGQQSVDGAHAGGDGLADRLARQRRDAGAVNAARFGGDECALAVDRPAEAVEHPAQQLG